MDGKGMPMAGAAPGAMLAPALAGSKTVIGWREGPIHVLLQGLTGDIDGKKYEGQMVSMATNDDAWIAGVLSYVRNTFGNSAGFVMPEDVARIRARDQGSHAAVDRRGTARHAAAAARQSQGVEAHRQRQPADCGARRRWQAGDALQHRRVQSPAVVPDRTAAGDGDRRARTRYRQVARTTTRAATRSSFPPMARTGARPSTGKGNGAVTDITFPPAKAKFIRITQTGAVAGNFWSIHELKSSPRSPPPRSRKTACRNQVAAARRRLRLAGQLR